MSLQLTRRAVTRDLRERNVRVMLAALLIAVTTVATINCFADQLRRTLLVSASAFLAADRQLSSRTSAFIPEEWFAEARQFGLQTGQMAEFSTMVASESQFQLVSVKAVDAAYPLRGELEWQADLNAPRQVIRHGPAVGEVWLNPRLMRLLDSQPGSQIEVGSASFTVAGLLVREPDASMNFAALAPRLMMHFDDIDKTEVIQPGSRIRHRGLFAGSETAIAEFEHWLQPQLDSDYRWRDVRRSEGLASALDRAEGFLLLGGSLAVLLAVVAIAVASREYALGQRDRVALLKTLGLEGRQIRNSYLSRLLIWAILTIGVALLLAIPLAWLLATLTAQLLDQPVDFQFRLAPLWPALLTAFLALFAYAYPPIARLRHTPAMRVFRSNTAEPARSLGRDLLLSSAAVFVLLWLYVRDGLLVLALLAGVVSLLVILLLFSWVVIRLLRHTGKATPVWRMACNALNRHRNASISQLSVFALTLMLAATLVLVRGSLLADWQAQLPEQAPNHFLLNVAPDQVGEVQQFLGSNQLDSNPLYPIVRGRLTQINGEDAQQRVADAEQISELNRELSLTAARLLPEDNRIIAGQWFNAGEMHGVSIEASLAETLNVGLGDALQFRIGAEHISQPITSIRSVQWDSMRPNFFIMFPEGGALEGLPASWLTSFYLAEQDKPLLNDFVRQFPTIAVLEIDHLIERIQSIISQVSQAIEAILLLILLAAIAVMLAVVSATIAERQREGALLRTLGAQQQLLNRATMLEFALIGLLAGGLGTLAAEIAVWALQYRLFEGSFRWHWPVMLVLPIVSAVLLALLGRWQLKPVLQVSPMLLLRRLE